LFNKLKTKKYHAVGTVPKHSRKIVERGKIDTLNKYMTALFPAQKQKSSSAAKKQKINKTKTKTKQTVTCLVSCVQISNGL
jgi:hypothetical protein